ncbi:MAG: hypothetical protein ACU0CI_05650, partial [Shimia sp.]
MTLFHVRDLVEAIGLDPRTCRMLRHDDRATAAYERDGLAGFGSFCSFQKGGRRSPYFKAASAVQCLPGPTLPDGRLTARVLGATHIRDRWVWDAERFPALYLPLDGYREEPNPLVEAYDLEWVPALQEHENTILIDWGLGARSWSQWVHSQNKRILEWRRTSLEPPFPGFAAFSARIGELATLPRTWRAALGASGGVYLLVTDTGAQYVGSASGEDGFWGRWQAYAANGHGGNVLLQAAG